jgi:hypothetical protein
VPDLLCCGLCIRVPDSKQQTRFPRFVTDLLLDVNLQQVPDQYLNGTWQVAERVLSQANPTTALARATQLQLQPGVLAVVTPTHRAAGHWSVNRDELLSRPYLLLHTADEEATALVTRLRRSADGLRSALTLYFQTGMELHLVLS